MVRKARVPGGTRHADCVPCASMKIQWTKLLLAGAFLLTTSLLAVDPARAAEGAGEEERAVWKATAIAMSREATRTRPPKTLYHKSDFGEASLMVSFAKDSIGGFCGLTGQAASAMSAELKAVNAQSIAFDETLVEGTGLKLTSK